MRRILAFSILLIFTESSMAQRKIDKQKLKSAHDYLSRNTSVYAKVTFAELKDLKKLVLWDINDQGLGYLEALPKLEEVSLYNNRKITDAGMVSINKLTYLKILYLEGTRISDRGIQKLTALKNLQEIALPDGITETGFRHLSVFFPQLNLLRMPASTSNSQFAAVTSIKQIQSLVAPHSLVSDESLQSIGRMSNLRELHLTDTAITDTGLGYLHNSNLENLSVGKTKVRGTGLAYLSDRTRLKNLHLYGCEIDDIGLSSIARLKTLERLVLSKTRITDAGMKYIGELHALNDLVLSDVRITAKGIEHIKNLRNLQKLDISFTDVGGGVVWILEDMKSLKMMSIQGSNIGPIAARWLRWRRPDIEFWE